MFKVTVAVLPDFYFLYFKTTIRCESVINISGYILSRRLCVFEMIDVGIQPAMVQFIYYVIDFIVHDFRINKSARVKIWFSGYSYLNYVIVPVTIRIGTFLKDRVILLIGKTFNIKAMCSREFVLSCKSYNFFYSETLL